ncbi:hypothetical protein [Nocardia sp. NPDC052112]|uniref:hypothetical protein n=1 Tax=Nocardia sp. NPDC052112 TaxID=3155646 RepID=UPI00342CA461
MTVKATEWTMISDISPESAYRETGSEAAVWRLSWLPDRRLNREQAMAGMELDEILSDPDIVHDRHAHADAAVLAGTVGIIWEQAVILLSKRIIARLDQGLDEASCEATGRSFTSHRMSRHDRPPRVFR